MDNCVVGYNDIFNGLKMLGLPESPVILVHSSLKSFGKVDGGAQTVIRALFDLCGSKGTLVMPTLTFSSVDEAAPFFDVIETPSDTGYITEVFRKMPGVKRSMHLFSSAAAFGQDAEYITEEHYNTPGGLGSPYWKIIELHGYSLFIGADFECNTLFHSAEEAVNPPYFKYKTICDARIKDYNRNMTVRDYRRYDCYQTGIKRKLDRMEPIFRKNGVIRDTKIGNSNIMLIPAEDNFRISCEMLRNNPEFILE